jgi:hypothetical protein
MLLDNAVEGCVRETFGAAVGLWQAKQAGDAKVAKAMRQIAPDELIGARLSPLRLTRQGCHSFIPAFQRVFRWANGGWRIASDARDSSQLEDEMETVWSNLHQAALPTLAE